MGALVVLLLAPVAVAGPGDDPAAAGRTVPVDSNAPIRMAQSDRRSGDTAAPRLHGSLARLQSAHARREADLPAASGIAAELIEDDSVLVEIRTGSGSRTAADLGALGGEIRHRLGDSAIEAWVPIEQLDELTALADVVRVWPARMPEFLEGSVTSQGVAAGQAGPWHAAGLDGDGVTIAIIDRFHRSEATSLQGSGDWPPSSQLTREKIGPGIFGDNNELHGNAVLELAYDVAPGADYIAYDTLTLGDWIEAINDAVSRDADIISASLGAPLDGIGDGSALDGSVAEAVEAAEAAGVIYINAAGNSREQHWGGLYEPSANDSNIHDWDGSGQEVNYHVPGNGDAWCVEDDAPLRGELFWNDWDDVDHDYALVLAEFDGNEWQEIARSDESQTGGLSQTPQEFVNVTANSSFVDPCDGAGAGVYGWIVVRNSAPTHRNLQFFTQIDPDEQVTARSLGFPADSPSAVTVAALNVSNSNHEPYSSEGPILAPGGGLPTGSEYPKPDVASFARTDTATYGAGAFAGTSAAAPHVAGMAALLKQRHPGMARAELVDRLQQISVTGSNDLGDSDHDFQHGYGRLRFQLEDALVVTDQPVDVEVDEPIGPVELELRDDEGLVVLSGPTSELNAAIGNDPSGGDATLDGTTTRSVVDGVSTFDDLSIDTSGIGYSLSLDSAGPGPAETNSFDVDSAPTQLSFDVQPSDSEAGQAISPAVVVQVLDGDGKVVTDDNSTEVELSIAAGPGHATLSGGGPVAVSSGEAVFDAVSIDVADTGYQLEATDTGGALDPDTSASFDITHGSAATLAFEVQPSDTKLNQAVTPAITVQVRDSHGNVVTDDNSTDVQLALVAGPGGATLSGSGPETVASGEAVFDAVSIDEIGEAYQLEATGGGFDPDISVAFNIIPGDPDSLSFVVQPSDGTTGDPIEPAVEVEVLDAEGNRVTWDDSTRIELLLSDGSGDNLSGGGPLTVTEGLAVFDSLIVDQAGTGYQLEAVDPDGHLPPTSSSLFDVIVDDIFADRLEDTSP